MKVTVLLSILLGFSCAALAQQTYSSSCLNYVATPADCDASVCNTEGGHAMYLFSGSVTNGDTQYVFQNGAGNLTQVGQALVLTGTLVPFADPSNTQDSFMLNLVFTPATGSGYGMVEVTDPSSVNQALWAYFELSSADSIMVGMGANAGMVVNVTQQEMMMPLQIGVGASGKNMNFGAAVWITLTVNGQTVSGDINLDLSCSAFASSSSSSSSSTGSSNNGGSSTGSGSGSTGMIMNDSGSSSTSTGSIGSTPVVTVSSCASFVATPANCDTSVCNSEGGHALYLFSGALTNGDTQYVFQNGAGVLTNVNGGLVLSGTLVPFSDASDTQDSFALNLVFTPLSGSGYGMNELTDAALVNQASWSFFELDSQRSTMNGLGANAGLILNVTQQEMMMPLQIGVGANGKNLNFGGAVWVTLTANGQSVSGDINIDLPLCAAATASASGSATASAAGSNESGSAAGANESGSAAGAGSENNNQADNADSNDSGVEHSSASSVAVSLVLVAVAAVLSL